MSIMIAIHDMKIKKIDTPDIEIKWLLALAIKIKKILTNIIGDLSYS